MKKRNPELTRHVPELEGAAAAGVLVEEERVAVGRLGVMRVVSDQDLFLGGHLVSKISSYKSIFIFHEM